MKTKSVVLLGLLSAMLVVAIARAGYVEIRADSENWVNDYDEAYVTIPTYAAFQLHVDLYAEGGCDAWADVYDGSSYYYPSFSGTVIATEYYTSTGPGSYVNMRIAAYAPYGYYSGGTISVSW